jgi:hypothetical protein
VVIRIARVGDLRLKKKTTFEAWGEITIKSVQKREEKAARDQTPRPRNGKELSDPEQRPYNNGKHTNRGRSTTSSSWYQQHLEWTKKRHKEKRN